MAATIDRPVLSSERVPHVDKTTPLTVRISDLGPQKGLDTTGSLITID
jgi:hypothetical protein